MVCLSPYLAAVSCILSRGGCAPAASEWSLPFHAEGGSLVLLGTSAFLSGADVLLLLLLLGTGGPLVTGADLLRLGGSTFIQTTYSVLGSKSQHNGYIRIGLPQRHHRKGIFSADQKGVR